MIQAFHAEGIKVMMDVVYNHTHNTGYADAGSAAAVGADRRTMVVAPN